jgi:hypothetical protein
MIASLVPATIPRKALYFEFEDSKPFEKVIQRKLKKIGVNSQNLRFYKHPGIAGFDLYMQVDQSQVFKAVFKADLEPA